MSATIHDLTRYRTRLAPVRSERLQVCLSPEERRRLDDLAAAAGFESLASYIRRCALGPAAGNHWGHDGDGPAAA